MEEERGYEFLELTQATVHSNVSDLGHQELFSFYVPRGASKPLQTQQGSQMARMGWRRWPRSQSNTFTQ